MKSREDIDEYVAASGAGPPGTAERELLERHLLTNDEGTCAQGCGACAFSCPKGVAIAEVLRTRMYARGYADPGYARDEYARLEADASPCESCTEQSCLDVCPWDSRSHGSRDMHTWLRG